MTVLLVLYPDWVVGVDSVVRLGRDVENTREVGWGQQQGQSHKEESNEPDEY